MIKKKFSSYKKLPDESFERKISYGVTTFAKFGTDYSTDVDIYYISNTN